jgi:hypothetical protein
MFKKLPNESRIVILNLVAVAGDQREDWINTAEVVDFTDILRVSRESGDTAYTGDENSNNDVGGLLGSSADNAIKGSGTGFINVGVTATDEDDHDPAKPEVFDLALIKERVTALSSFNYRTPIDYSYNVVNQGNMAVADIALVDSLLCGAILVQGLNSDWKYNALIGIATKTIAGPLETLVQGITAH